MNVYVVLEINRDAFTYRGTYGTLAKARAAIEYLQHPQYGPLPEGRLVIGTELIEPEQGEARLPCEHNETEILYEDGAPYQTDWCVRCGSIKKDGEWRWPTYLPPSLASEPEAGRHD